MDLHLCLISPELFAWGKYGGFGYATRTIGRELVKRGVEVTVSVPRCGNQKPVDELDGMVVHGYPLHSYPFTGGIYRRLKADIYHSEEPSWGTKIAYETVKTSHHIVTCQNPKTYGDWAFVEKYYPLRRRLFNRLIQDLINSNVKKLDAIFCQAKYIIYKVKALYQLEKEPAFLPNPVEVPSNEPHKASDPTVCFLGRFDEEKQPEKFFELARSHPDIRFIAIGKAHDPRRDAKLRSTYSKIPNLELPGFLVGKVKDEILSKSWILINCSISECLPISFLEASAHGCAILSNHDPDNFSTSFGCFVKGDSFNEGLNWLIDDNRWKKRGEKGRKYVTSVHELEKVLDRHIQIYNKLIANS